MTGRPQGLTWRREFPLFLIKRPDRMAGRLAETEWLTRYPMC
jgi:hypothetical protein